MNDHPWVNETNLKAPNNTFNPSQFQYQIVIIHSPPLRHAFSEIQYQYLLELKKYFKPQIMK